MNAIAMLFQQIQAPKPMQANSKNAGEGGSVFQSLLSTEQINGRPPTSGLMQAGPEQRLLNIDGLSEELQTILKDILNQLGQGSLPNIEESFVSIDGLSNLQISLSELMKELNKLPMTDEVKDLLNQLVTESNQILMAEQVIPSISLGNVDTVDMTVLQKQFAELFAKVESILKQVGNQQDITKAAPKLLELLQQWTVLEKKAGSEQRVTDATNGALKNEASKEQAVWKELLQAYQKRNQLAAKQQYNSDAKVTSTDVSKWITKALDNQGQIDRALGQQTIIPTSQPISRLEQYVIHVNQTQSTTQSADQQLIEQFQKVINSSRFSALANGTNQLSIALRPNNLGEMMVRFTQINGEMTVKILVTSQAAKEMLESNMHQLRNMFSPQQVVVEKQEVNVQAGQETQKEQKDDQLAEHEQNQSQHSKKDDHQNKEGDFETQFHEMLMNEKV